MTINQWILSLGLLAAVTTSYGCSTRHRLVSNTEQQMAQQVLHAAKNRSFCIGVQWMKPLRGMSQQVNYGYDLTVNGDQVVSYLPYVGEVYQAPYGGGKGLNFTGTLTDYTVQQLNASTTRIDFKVRNDEDTYHYYIDLYSNGKAVIDVNANHRDAISYSGELTTRAQ